MPKLHVGIIQRGLATGVVREGLPEHGDPHAAFSNSLYGGEHRLLPFGIADVCARREAETVGELLHPVGAVGELPVAGHGGRA
jgi:hypothetical protein